MRRARRAGVGRGADIAGLEAITAIVSPLAAELAPLLAAATHRRRARAGSLRFTYGRVAGEPVALASTGDGARAAGERLGALLAAARPRRLLVLGVAGGLSPRLATGALIAAERVVGADGREAPGPDRAWLGRALAQGGGGKITGGTAVTGDRILVTPRDKEEALARALGGRRGDDDDAGPPAAPAVIDLESAVYAQVAAAAGIPYLAVRAVLDPAEEALPLDFNRCRRTAGGGVSGLRVMVLAFLHPPLLGALWKLRRRLRFCARRLASAAEELIAGRAPDALGEAASAAAAEPAARGADAAAGRPELAAAAAPRQAAVAGWRAGEPR
ncbi:MAG TPA: hypothetical protein VHR45_14370 [Thermoanaerobaculia bacterium]|nr:hypothetical protein [Thermoanaerobaculia bacterium]